MSASDQINQAQRLHAAGDLAQAEKIYRQLLAANPNHAEAIHYLGMVAFQRGQPTEALQLLERSVQLAPRVGPFFQNLARVYQSTDQPGKAADALRQAASLDPAHLGLLLELAFALTVAGRLTEAQDHLQRALANWPDHPDVLANLGVVLAKLDQHEQAIYRYHAAMRRAGEQPALLINLGLSLKALRRHVESLAAYDRAIQLNPNIAEAHEFRGLLLASMAHYDEAIESHRRAVELAPNSATAWNNLGTAYQKKGDAASGLASFDKAISLNPNYAEAQNNRATALIDAGDIAAALPCYNRAIELAPDSPDLKRNRALVMLALGDYENGWREMESRLDCVEWISRREILVRPRWGGSPLGNQTLLVHAEQGFGDTIQFARLLKPVIDRCPKVVLECQPPLMRLLSESFPKIQVVARGEPLPQYDLQIPLMSLPLIFGTRADSIPNQVPYLSAPPDRQDFWQSELAADQKIFKIGLVFAGTSIDPHRKLQLDDFKAMNDLPGIQLFSLQRELIGESPIQIRDLSDRLTDFAETAAIIENLDLIISVDTAVAHLAGALAKPTWTLLRFSPDWRWTLAKQTTPWYPTMRLFRQPKIGDWQSALNQVIDELRSLLTRAPG